MSFTGRFILRLVESVGLILAICGITWFAVNYSDL